MNVRGQALHCLTFDLGASGGKIAVAAYDGSRISIDHVHRFPNGVHQLADGLYWNFIGIWNEYLTGIGKGLSLYPDISSVGACTYCNDFSFVGKGGELLAPVRAYRDPRTIRTADEIYSVMSREELYAVSGNQIAPFNTLMQLAAMKAEHADAVLGYADALIFLPDLLTFYLTGERVTERSIASVTQMYDHGTGDWSPEVLRRFGIDRKLFAPFVSAGTAIGRIEPNLLGGIGAPVLGAGGIDAVVTAEHDTASAFMGTGVDSGEDVFIVSSGTWSLAGCESAGPIINDYGFRYNIANEGGVEGHHRLIRNIMGNWLIQEVLREYESEGVACDFGRLGAEAAKLDPYRFVVDADMDGFYEPGGMREKIAGVCFDLYGDAPNTPAEFFVCVSTSLAFKYRWAMERLENLRGREFSYVNIIGGGSRDGLTAQRTADVTCLPVICGPADASALGNVVFQLIAAGEIAGVDEGRELISGSTDFKCYEPTDTERSDMAYAQFIEDFLLHERS
jgi:sugar (pentulose or hexulose) kinase